MYFLRHRNQQGRGIKNLSKNGVESKAGLEYLPYSVCALGMEILKPDMDTLYPNAFDGRYKLKPIFGSTTNGFKIDTYLAGKGTASTTRLLSNTPPNATQMYVKLMSKIIVVIGNLAWKRELCEGTCK